VLRGREYRAIANRYSERLASDIGPKWMMLKPASSPACPVEDGQQST
jgi:hypothetical protein